MKKICTILFALSSLWASAQCPKVPQFVNTYYEFWGCKLREIAQMPRHAPLASCRDTGMYYFNPVDSSIYTWTGNTFVTSLQHADQGLFDSTHTVQLGEPLNQTGSPARFYQKREVPLNGNAFRIWDSLYNSVTGAYTQRGDTMHTTSSGTVVVQETHQADLIGDFYNWQSFRPKNYLTVYPGAKPNGGDLKAMDWTFGYSQNSSGGLPMPDNVYGMGYNILNGVGRKDTSDAALSLRLETSFAVLGTGGAFELHWPEVIDFNGGLHRINSWYMSKLNASTLWESNLGDHQYKHTFQHPGQVYLEIADQSGDFPQITMTGTHAASIDGIIQFTDSNGHNIRVRSIDGDFFIIQQSAVNAFPFYIDPNSTVFLNNTFSALAPLAGTVVGNYDDGSYPSNVSKAQLAVVSQHKGVLLAPMNDAEMNAIASPGDGLVVYNTDVNKLFWYDGNLGTWTVNPTGHTLFAPATGGTVNLLLNNYAAIHPAAAIATLTINFPSNPHDNDLVEIKLTQVVTTVTWGNGTVENPPTSNVSGYLKFVYDASLNTWY